jgi:hypothetical protein
MLSSAVALIFSFQSEFVHAYSANLNGATASVPQNEAKALRVAIKGANGPKAAPSTGAARAQPAPAGKSVFASVMSAQPPPAPAATSGSGGGGGGEVVTVLFDFAGTDADELPLLTGVTSRCSVYCLTDVHAGVCV